MNAQAENKVEIHVDNPARKEVLAAELAKTIHDSGCATVGPQDATERLIPSEVFFALTSSGALLVLAAAIRDFAKKHKVDLTIIRPTGEFIKIKASGAELDDVSDLVGYLEKGHTKTTKETRQTQSRVDRTDKIPTLKPQEPAK
ncbi:MAG: hypothetical protein LAO30_22250 [Acidobacteriia bacterium]|nr:hypothetical protein [Terriglobia bacterium]